MLLLGNGTFICILKYKILFYFRLEESWSTMHMVDLK